MCSVVVGNDSALAEELVIVVVAAVVEFAVAAVVEFAVAAVVNGGGGGSMYLFLYLVMNQKTAKVNMSRPVSKS